MRRFLLLISLLAVVLVGLGDRSVALIKGRCIACEETVSALALLPTGSELPLRCCAKHAVPAYALELRFGESGTRKAGLHREPSPCPDFVIQAVPAVLPGVPLLAAGHAVEALPERYPAPLSRTCVLRI